MVHIGGTGQSFHGVNPRRGRADMAFFDHFRDRRRIAGKDAFDRAIAAIANPSPELKTFRRLAAPGTKKHSLDMAPDQETNR